MRLPLRRPRYADVAATLALIIASTGTAYAAATIGTADIIDGAVTAPKLAPEAVTAAKLAPNSVGSGVVKTNSLTLSDIKGVDVKGTISLSVGGNTCGTITLAVAGAVAGQAGLLTWTSTVPTHILIGPLMVADATHIKAVVCNLSSTPFSGTGIGVRIVTFG